MTTMLLRSLLSVGGQANVNLCVGTTSANLCVGSATIFVVTIYVVSTNLCVDTCTSTSSVTLCVGTICW